MPSMSRAKFLKEYVLKVEKEFELDGETAEWAPSSSGGPLEWGQEHSSMEIVKTDASADRQVSSTAMALSPDNKLQNLQGERRHHRMSDMKNRLHSLTHWKGHFPSFGSKPLSADGERWLQVLNNESTQSGPRKPALLPTIIVRHFSNIHSATYLYGHTDAIMWSSFSPTNSSLLASASWDGTFRLWSASDGREISKISSGDVQDWSGDFSPDGKHILFAGTDCVSIYSIEAESQILKLKREGLKTEAWIRYLSWAPGGDAIALGNGMGVLLWRPFDDQKKSASWDRVDEVLKLGVEEAMHSTFPNV
ncbi:uncharacterized protein MYCFIDRAFT_81635 [Pseudocercospora fijiensis CIRAD86]|uniref:Uncharacterized protein n=1 Tax=Pseudocercospora fijiensis (strain CIRAD86) TaxID=383855 RepID=M3B2B8_PSEFD|nr:uncharacterized protein MYCFIDRAFT_81635 [Pseudocercospora fijiensis CIRAD86]EME83518.1 hypothetical protein MYCFIDRAFT_81635 [Pseudocercospora fijiensis CIRAD86]